MRGFVAFVTAPVWLPMLVAAGCASIAIGMVVVTMTSALKSKVTPDVWDVD